MSVIVCSIWIFDNNFSAILDNINKRWWELCCKKTNNGWFSTVYLWNRRRIKKTHTAKWWTSILCWFIQRSVIYCFGWPRNSKCFKLIGVKLSYSMLHIFPVNDFDVIRSIHGIKGLFIQIYMYIYISSHARHHINLIRQSERA